MPCMGPSEATDKQTEEIFLSVLEHLKTKHHIVLEGNCYFSGLMKNRLIVLQKLKDAVREVITQDNYEGF